MYTETFGGPTKYTLNTLLWSTQNLTLTRVYLLRTNTMTANAIIATWIVYIWSLRVIERRQELN